MLDPGQYCLGKCEGCPFIVRRLEKIEAYQAAIDVKDQLALRDDISDSDALVFAHSLVDITEPTTTERFEFYHATNELDGLSSLRLAVEIFRKAQLAKIATLEAKIAC